MASLRDTSRPARTLPGESDRSGDLMVYRTSRQIVEGRQRRVSIEGVLWTVYERELPYDANLRSLIFETDKAARRVRGYPATWFALTDDELAVLARSR